jgi:hypothetical protein
MAGIAASKKITAKEGYGHQRTKGSSCYRGAHGTMYAFRTVSMESELFP